MIPDTDKETQKQTQVLSQKSENIQQAPEIASNKEDQILEKNEMHQIQNQGHILQNDEIHYLDKFNKYEFGTTLKNIIFYPDYVKQSTKFYNNSKSKFIIEIINAIVLTLYQIPGALIFSIIARVHPIHGIYSCFFMNLFSSILGGKPGLISGISPGIALTIRYLMAPSGPLENYSYEDKFHHLMWCLIWVGIWNLLASAIRFPQFFRLTGYPVKATYFCSLVIIVFISQLDIFQKCKEEDQQYFCMDGDDKEYYSFGASETWISIGYALFVAIFVFLVNKIPKVGYHLLAPVIALTIVSIIEHHGVRGSDESIRTIEETWPGKFQMAEYAGPDSKLGGDGYKWGTIIEYSAYFFFMSYFETMFSIEKYEKVKDVTQDYFSWSQEMFTQGIGSIFCGLFGGIGGGTQYYETKLNIKHLKSSGKISSLLCSILILILGSYAYQPMEKIPIAGLTGLVYFYFLRDMEWRTILMMVRRKCPLRECLLIIFGTALAAVTQIIYGLALVISCLAIAGCWEESETFEVKIEYCTLGDKKIKIYKIFGNLYFTCVRNFQCSLTPDLDEKHVILDLSNSKVLDFSALNALNDMCNRYNNVTILDEKTGKQIPNPKQLWILNLDEVSKQTIKQSQNISHEVTMVPEDYIDQLPNLWNLPPKGTVKDHEEHNKEENEENDSQYKEDVKKNDNENSKIKKDKNCPINENSENFDIEIVDDKNNLGLDGGIVFKESNLQKRHEVETGDRKVCQIKIDKLQKLLEKESSSNQVILVNIEDQSIQQQGKELQVENSEKIYGGYDGNKNSMSNNNIKFQLAEISDDKLVSTDNVNGQQQLIKQQEKKEKK